MQLVIISGRSGSGKSIALQALEDLGFYAIDNLPAMLLGALVEELENGHSRRIAVSIDARNLPEALKRFPGLLADLKRSAIDCQVVYLTSDARVLLERYSHTRRRHPLTRNTQLTLAEAIDSEEQALTGMRDLADLLIDTTRLSVHELRGRIADQVAGHSAAEMTLTVESFGFKRGVPPDADIVFDARCLPNPYWDPTLRDSTGSDASIIAFLEGYSIVDEMYADILAWVEKWLPEYRASQRSYLTVAIGCTGGQHRSVYLAERLGHALAESHPRVRLRHRELGQQRRLGAAVETPGA